MGSAVAVAAGFSPLALGTETIGSIITPASRASLYALKPTVGLQDLTGLYSLTDFFDSPGPMAKSSSDLIALTEILLERSFPPQNHGGWDGLSIGFLDPRVWKTDEAMCRQHEGTAEQMIGDYESMVERLRAQGCALKYPVGLADVSALMVDGEHAIMPIACECLVRPLCPHQSDVLQSGNSKTFASPGFWHISTRHPSNPSQILSSSTKKTRRRRCPIVCQAHASLRFACV